LASAERKRKNIFVQPLGPFPGAFRVYLSCSVTKGFPLRSVSSAGQDDVIGVVSFIAAADSAKFHLRSAKISVFAGQEKSWLALNRPLCLDYNCSGAIGSMSNCIAFIPPAIVN